MTAPVDAWLRPGFVGVRVFNRYQVDVRWGRPLRLPLTVREGRPGARMAFGHVLHLGRHACIVWGRLRRL